MPNRFRIRLMNTKSRLSSYSGPQYFWKITLTIVCAILGSILLLSLFRVI